MNSALTLFEATLDGRALSEDEEDALDRWLYEDPAAADAALDAAWTHELLARQFLMLPAAPLETTSPCEGAPADVTAAPLQVVSPSAAVAPDRTGPTARCAAAPMFESRGSGRAATFPLALWRRWAVAAAVLVAIGVGNFLSNRQSKEFFQVIEAADAAHPDGSRVATGTHFEPGDTLTLSTGAVQFQRGKAALVFIEAPAEIHFDSGEALSLRSGTLRARVHGGESFTVRTPRASVVDLGTEFGVRVGRSSEHVAVFVGAVEVRTASERNPPMTLVAGQQAILGADDLLKASDFDPTKDRIFAVRDQAEWRRRIETMEQGPDDLDLQRIDGLYAFQRFAGVQGHGGPTFGFQRVMLHEQLPGGRSEGSRAADIGGVGGLVIGREEAVELVPNTEFGSRLASGGCIDEDGCVRADGAEVWLGWRVRHEAGRTARGGLTLAKALHGISQTQLFVGVPADEAAYVLTVPTHRLGDAAAFSKRILRPGVDVPREAGSPRKETHFWIARLSFYDTGKGRGTASVWCDVEADDLGGTESLAEMSNAQLAFNRIQLWVDQGSPPMLVDFVVLADGPEAIFDALASP